MRDFKKKEIAFFDKGLEGSRGETNKLLALPGTLVNLRYLFKALTGQRRSSDLSVVKEHRPSMQNSRGTADEADSILAKNSGEKDKRAEPSRPKPTDEERAWSSPTR